VHPDLLGRLQKNSGFSSWNLTLHPSRLEEDPRGRENFIYLSADATEELEISSLTKDHVLIIGGFVDRNRHKGLTFKKASELGIRTAKLPIGKYMQLISSQVLTVNHVVEILAKAFDCNDWEAAVRSVVPERKVSVGR
jgi:tRNA (guanine9-N1)-methyltransferase